MQTDVNHQPENETSGTPSTLTVTSPEMATGMVAINPEATETTTQPESEPVVTEPAKPVANWAGF